MAVVISSYFFFSDHPSSPPPTLRNRRVSSAVSGFGQVKTCRHATDEAPLHKREKTSGTQVTLQFVLQIQQFFFFKSCAMCNIDLLNGFKYLSKSCLPIQHCSGFFFIIFCLLDLHKGANAEACSL